MAIPRPGLLVGGALMAACGLLFATWVGHWFPITVLLLGLSGICLAFVPASPVAVAGAPTSASAVQMRQQSAAREGDDLRAHLGQLERLRADGVLSAAEYKRKRADLVAAWGRPPVDE